MQVRVLGPNQTEITFDGPNSSGIERIFFSYGVPVVVTIGGYGTVKTDKFHSITTSKHINNYLKVLGYKAVPNMRQLELTEYVGDI